MLLLQWLQELINKVEVAFGDNIKPNHVLINEYQSGQGIMVINLSKLGIIFIRW